MSSDGVDGRNGVYDALWLAVNLRGATDSCISAAYLFASPASLSASAALSFSRPTISVVSSRRLVSIRDAQYVNPSSPATPNVTRIPPASSFMRLQGNVAAGLLSSSMNSWIGSQYSTTNPITTAIVESRSNPPTMSSRCSSLRESLSKADKSISRFERIQAISALLIGFVPIALICIYGQQRP
jgi:hypothetical protein